MNPVVRKPWWRETEVVWLIVLVVAAYFLRAGELPLRGEEPTRAQIAREMVISGDWVVPQEQGEPFMIRPPLQTWVIAASCVGLDSWGPWAVRLPSLIATLLATLVIYGYGRTFLTRTGALAAGLVFVTFADMFQMGRQAETEALFILLVSASLLTWHWGSVRGWPDALTFGCGYGLMALGMLTKGLQAPTYFVGSVGVYLVLTRSWRRLFSVGHLVGMVVGAAVLAAWVGPYYFRMGWSGVHAVWLGDPAYKVREWAPAAVAVHLLRYPLEIAAGTLPWSLLLLPYASRDFRRLIGAARPQVQFLTVCLAIAFPTCWIPPGGQPRFFAPLYPCLALLVALVVERCLAVDAVAPLRAFWRRYLGVSSVVMALAGVVTLVLAFGFASHAVLGPWAEPPLVAIAFATLAAALAVVVRRAGRDGNASAGRWAVPALAVFLVITFAGVITDGRVRRCEKPTDAMARLRQQLPPGQQLVSLGGHTDSLFAYLYGPPTIVPKPWPRTGDDAEDAAYFCFVSFGDSRPPLPFPWQEIAAISLDRNHHAIPEKVEVIGRRLPATPASGVAADLRKSAPR